MIHDHLHDAMHRLPGFPEHDEASARHANQAGRDRAARWNANGKARAQRWNSNAQAERRHAKAPRVLVGLQEFIARRAGGVR
jgi:hypothetical protein